MCVCVCVSLTQLGQAGEIAPLTPLQSGRGQEKEGPVPPRCTTLLHQLGEVGGGEGGVWRDEVGAGGREDQLVGHLHTQLSLYILLQLIQPDTHTHTHTAQPNLLCVLSVYKDLRDSSVVHDLARGPVQEAVVHGGRELLDVGHVPPDPLKCNGVLLVFEDLWNILQLLRERES